MLEVDPLLQEAILGSHRPAVQARAWYDGQLSYPDDLPVESWSITVDGDNPVERRISLEVVSDDPALDPVALTSPLSVWGQEIELRAGVAMPDRDILCPLGQFVIWDSSPTAAWRTYRQHTPLGVYEREGFGGLRVSIDARDRAAKLAQWRLTEPIQSPAGSTVYAELARLVNPLGVTGAHEVPNRTLAANIVYDTQERLTAIDQLARYVDARVIVNTDGLFVLVPRTQTRGRWDIPAGVDSVVVRVDRGMSRDDFTNAVFSSGRHPDTQEDFLGWCREGVEYGDQSSPLRWGGPAGNSPAFRDSPLITSRDAAFADAGTAFSNAVRRREATIRIECPLNPALEPYDVISVPLPGKGVVEGVVRSWRGGSSGLMEVTAAVPLDVWMEIR